MAHIVIDTSGPEPVVHGQTSFTAGPESSPVGWRWDNARLVVRRSPLNFHPIYLLHQDHRFGVSDCATELLPYAPSARLDRAAIAVFLRTGSYIGDDTPFDAVRAMPPVDGLTWAGGKLVLGAGFTQPERSGLNRAAIKSRYRRLFEAAIASSIPSADVAVPITGGRDSRHILLELHMQGRTPSGAFTALMFPPRTAEDIRIGGQLAARIGLPHRLVPMLHSRFSAELEKNRRTSFASDMHGWALAVSDAIGQMAMFDGLGGDVLSESTFLSKEQVALYEAGRLYELADLLLARRDAEVSRRLGPAASLFPLAMARERMRDELAKYAQLHNPMTQFAFWNRARRAVSPNTFQLFGHRNEMHTPFLHEDLASFLLSIPTAETIGKTLHTETILESYPDFADVPFEDKTAPAARDRAAALAFSVRLAQYGQRERASSVWDGKALARMAAHAVKSGAVPHAMIQGLYLSQLRAETGMD